MRLCSAKPSSVQLAFVALQLCLHELLELLRSTPAPFSLPRPHSSTMPADRRIAAPYRNPSSRRCSLMLLMLPLLLQQQQQQQYSIVYIHHCKPPTDVSFKHWQLYAMRFRFSHPSLRRHRPLFARVNPRYPSPPVGAPSPNNHICAQIALGCKRKITSISCEAAPKQKSDARFVSSSDDCRISNACM